MGNTPLASDITSLHTFCALAFVGGHEDVSKDGDSGGRQAGIKTPAVKEVSSPNMLCFCLVLKYCSHVYVEGVEAPHHSSFKLEHFQVQSTKTINLACCRRTTRMHFLAGQVLSMAMSHSQRSALGNYSWVASAVCAVLNQEAKSSEIFLLIQIS